MMKKDDNDLNAAKGILLGCLIGLILWILILLMCC